MVHFSILDCMIQRYDTISDTCHQAIPYVLHYLQVIQRKDRKAFAACFGPGPFFANLPGGVQVRQVKELIDMHIGFFDSPVTRFDYERPVLGVGGADFFTCSVAALVTLPNRTERRVCIDMTFFSAKQPAWVPGRLINTVVDPVQAVLEK
jgi:hypothetical protein